jgi:hypothetical protein
VSSDAVNYSQVACRCKRGHLLGTIVATRWSIRWYNDRPLSNNNMQLSGGKSITVGEKVKADCAECRKEGHYSTDYQASWNRVDAALAQARDTRFGRTTLEFG